MARFKPLELVWKQYDWQQVECHLVRLRGSLKDTAFIIPCWGVDGAFTLTPDKLEEVGSPINCTVDAWYSTGKLDLILNLENHNLAEEK